MSIIAGTDTGGPADTWIGLLLGGFIGSVIGGAVTFGAVWLTIRHERKLREGDRLDLAVSAAYAAAGSFMARVVQEKRLSKVPLPEYSAFLQQVSTAAAVAHRVSPPLARLLGDALLELSSAVDALTVGQGSQDDLKRAAMHVHVALGRWLAQPADIEQGKTSMTDIRQAAHEAQDSAVSRAGATSEPKRWPWDLRRS